MADNYTTETVDSSSPTAEAYESSNTQGLKGRFAGNSANIRLFKDNPYILDYDDKTRSELNKSLMKPYQGEHFYDDDFYDYICHYEKDSVSGEISYVYTCKEKELSDKLKYYETQGVLNQLISSYNNGRVYKFFVDRSNRMMYPDSSLVFPEEYVSYTVRAQGLNSDDKQIFVAGTLTDSALASTKLYLTKTVDSVTGTTYRRMTAASIFGAANIDKQYDIVVNNNFYVVEFYNDAGTIIDTKLFQAVDATIDNIAYPSIGVVGLEVQVIRGSVKVTSASNIYPLLIGEDFENNISYRLIATYSNGDRRDISNLIDDAAGHISIEGKDAVTTSNGAVVGQEYPVTFTYYPDATEDGGSIGQSVSATIIFQIATNTYKELYKIIPVMWETTNTNSISSQSYKTFALKVWSMSTDGIIENRTKTFVDTMVIVDSTSTGDSESAVPYDYYYNPYTQLVEFTVSTSINSTIFKFNMFSKNQQYSYKFRVNFSNESGIFVDGTGMSGQSGYETGGVLATLGETMYNESVFVGSTGTRTAKFTLSSPSTNATFREKYARTINGTTIYPTALQIYLVKDYSYQPLTDIVEFGSGEKTVTVTANDGYSAVSSLLSTLNTYDHLLVKFYYKGETDTLVNFDTYRVTTLSV